MFEKKINNLSIVLLAVVLFIIVLSIVAGSVPPVSRDALIHHLAVPKRYLQNGGMFEMPSMVFSYYPMNIDLLYMLPLSLGNDIFPKYLHLTFAVLTALLLWNYLKSRCGDFWGLLGAILFLTTPIIFKLSSVAYVDLGLVFFSFASILSLLRWRTTVFKAKYLIISAIFGGLALGTKYNGLLVVLILMLLLPWLFLKGQHDAKSLLSNRGILRLIRVQLFFLCIALFLFSPWMIRNYRWTGNPVYPLYNRIFTMSTASVEQDIRPSQPELNLFFIRRAIYGETWPQILSIPFRIFFQGQDGSPRHFDGKLNPFLGIFPIFAFIRRKSDKVSVRQEKYYFLWFSILYLIFALFAFVYRIRYISVVIPPLVVLSVFGLHNLGLFARQTKSLLGYYFLRSCFCGLVLISLYVNFDYMLERFKHIEPLAYLSGQVSRNEYISRYNPEYPLVVWANNHLPSDSRVLLLFSGSRNYYLDRTVHLAPDIMQKNSDGNYTTEDIVYKMKRYGTTHVIIGYSQFQSWLKGLPSLKDREIYQWVFENMTHEIYQANGYKLLAMKE